MIQIDMEMPEKCGLCPLFHAEHPMYCQGVKADRKKKIVAPYRDPRPEWCPIPEIQPDPDTVSRKAVLDAVCEELDSIDHVPQWVFDRLTKKIENLPSAQPELCEGAVSRRRLLSDLKELIAAWEKYPVMAEQIKGVEAAIGYVESIPSAQEKRTEERTETHTCDCISRQAAIEEIIAQEAIYSDDAVEILKRLPSVQPEHTCVNCGRTANNGGWYADGRTRCPIEEHYALPKDGYCHLWEKRNVTDDDYPERREE